MRADGPLPHGAPGLARPQRSAGAAGSPGSSTPWWNPARRRAGHTCRPRHRFPRQGARGHPVAVRWRDSVRRRTPQSRRANPSDSWRNGRRRCRTSRSRQAPAARRQKTEDRRQKQRTRVQQTGTGVKDTRRMGRLAGVRHPDQGASRDAGARGNGDAFHCRGWACGAEAAPVWPRMADAERRYAEALGTEAGVRPAGATESGDSARCESGVRAGRRANLAMLGDCSAASWVARSSGQDGFDNGGRTSWRHHAGQRHRVLGGLRRGRSAHESRAPTPYLARTDRDEVGRHPMIAAPGIVRIHAHTRSGPRPPTVPPRDACRRRTPTIDP